MGALSRLQLITHPTETMLSDQSELELRTDGALAPGDFFNKQAHYRYQLSKKDR
jgi:hypothetical protein